MSADPIGQGGQLDEAGVALVGIPASPINLRRDAVEPAGWDYNLYGYPLNSPINFFDSTGLSTDRYVSDISGKHGEPHVDRYNKAGQNVGRYRPDGSPMDHKGKPSRSVPKSDKKRLKKALDKLKFGAIPAVSTFDAFCLSNPVECNQLFGEPLPPSPKEDCTEEQ